MEEDLKNETWNEGYKGLPLPMGLMPVYELDNLLREAEAALESILRGDILLGGNEVMMNLKEEDDSYGVIYFPDGSPPVFHVNLPGGWWMSKFGCLLEVGDDPEKDVGVVTNYEVRRRGIELRVDRDRTEIDKLNRLEFLDLLRYGGEYLRAWLESRGYRMKTLPYIDEPKALLERLRDLTQQKRAGNIYHEMSGLYTFEAVHHIQRGEYSRSVYLIASNYGNGLEITIKGVGPKKRLPMYLMTVVVKHGGEYKRNTEPVVPEEFYRCRHLLEEQGEFDHILLDKILDWEERIPNEDIIDGMCLPELAILAYGRSERDKTWHRHEVLDRESIWGRYPSSIYGELLAYRDAVREWLEDHRNHIEIYLVNKCYECGEWWFSSEAVVMPGEEGYEKAWSPFSRYEVEDKGEPITEEQRAIFTEWIIKHTLKMWNEKRELPILAPIYSSYRERLLQEALIMSGIKRRFRAGLVYQWPTHDVQRGMNVTRMMKR